MTVSLIFFFLLFFLVVCIVDLPLIKGTGRYIPKELFVYAGTLSMLGPIAEVSINHFTRAVFNYSLWEYKILPVHHGDTSLFSPFEWAIYGYHLYFLHKKLKTFNLKHEEIIFAFVVGFDALFMEALINICGIFYLDSYIFYYFPGDLFHLTTLLAAPFYILGGFAMSRTLKGFANDPWFFGITGFCTSYVFVFLL